MAGAAEPLWWPADARQVATRIGAVWPPVRARGLSADRLAAALDLESMPTERRCLHFVLPTLARKGDPTYLLDTLGGLLREFASPVVCAHATVVNVRPSRPHAVFDHARALAAASIGATVEDSALAPLLNESAHFVSRESTRVGITGEVPGIWRPTNAADVRQTHDVIEMLEALRGTACVPGKGKYFVFLEDDVVPCHYASLHIAYVLREANARFGGDDGWSVIRVSQGLIGVIAQCRDLDAYISYLDAHARDGPVDYVLAEFWTSVNAAGQAYFGERRREYVVYRYNLFQHRGRVSSFAGRTEGQGYGRVYHRCFDTLSTLLHDNEMFSSWCLHDDISPCRRVAAAPGLDPPVNMLRSANHAVDAFRREHFESRYAAYNISAVRYNSPPEAVLARGDLRHHLHAKHHDHGALLQLRSSSRARNAGTGGSTAGTGGGANPGTGTDTGTTTSTTTTTSSSSSSSSSRSGNAAVPDGDALRDTPLGLTSVTVGSSHDPRRTSPHPFLLSPYHPSTAAPVSPRRFENVRYLAARGTSCTSECSRVGLSCFEGGLRVANTCGLLQRYLGCSRCRVETGQDYWLPGAVIAWGGATVDAEKQLHERQLAAAMAKAGVPPPLDFQQEQQQQEQQGYVDGAPSVPELQPAWLGKIWPATGREVVVKDCAIAPIQGLLSCSGVSPYFEPRREEMFTRLCPCTGDDVQISVFDELHGIDGEVGLVHEDDPMPPGEVVEQEGAADQTPAPLPPYTERGFVPLP
jgi:hypothetical protein